MLARRLRGQRTRQGAAQEAEERPAVQEKRPLKTDQLVETGVPGDVRPAPAAAEGTPAGEIHGAGKPRAQTVNPEIRSVFAERIFLCCARSGCKNKSTFGL